MKKIIEYRKLLGVDKNVTLKDLKMLYRNFMKDWHPDKFQHNEDKLNAEEKSKAFIEAYHFLVSISPETHEAEVAEYTGIITNSRIRDYVYKSNVLQINFIDGSVYEYFDVSRNVYNKFLQAETPDRFARRHIYHSFIYRKVSKAVVA